VLLGWRRRADGGGHEGLDYAISTGDMIRASAGGTVIFAGNEPRRFGKLVVIDHGGGWHSAYGHLDRVTVTKGEAVKGGERIGIGGQGGVATRPELHFEIRRNGKPVDPATQLASD
jgi:murein DD-endopeptidase MepM/ murein hydrolase activator NlpD